MEHGVGSNVLVTLSLVVHFRVMLIVRCCLGLLFMLLVLGITIPLIIVIMVVLLRRPRFISIHDNGLKGIKVFVGRILS